MRDILETLLHRPFSRNEALVLGVTPRVLEGGRFARVHPRVYRHRDHAMVFDDEVLAARLALPSTPDGHHPASDAGARRAFAAPVAVRRPG
jgi:hypothetical protein